MGAARPLLIQIEITTSLLLSLISFYYYVHHIVVALTVGPRSLGRVGIQLARWSAFRVELILNLKLIQIQIEIIITSWTCCNII